MRYADFTKGGIMEEQNKINKKNRTARQILEIMANDGTLDLMEIEKDIYAIIIKQGEMFGFGCSLFEKRKSGLLKIKGE